MACGVHRGAPRTAVRVPVHGVSRGREHRVPIRGVSALSPPNLPAITSPNHPDLPLSRTLEPGLRWLCLCVGAART